jgi:hypothetical protein
MNALHFWRVRKMKRRTQHNGMNLWLTTGALLALPIAALFIGLGASQPMRPPVQAQTAVSAPTPPPAILGKKTHLGCQQQLSDGLTVAVNLTNTTRQTLPKGTRVYWQTQTGISDWVTINNEHGLPPESVLKGIHSDWMKGGPCTAHYFKPAEAVAVTHSRIRGPAF